MLAAYAGKIAPARELRRLNASYALHDKNGNTALHWACVSKNAELVDWMLQDGADASPTNGLGRTPLIVLGTAAHALSAESKRNLQPERKNVQPKF